jgi:hypothetical protein
MNAPDCIEDAMDQENFLHKLKHSSININQSKGDYSKYLGIIHIDMMRNNKVYKPVITSVSIDVGRRFSAKNRGSKTASFGIFEILFLE